MKLARLLVVGLALLVAACGTDLYGAADGDEYASAVKQADEARKAHGDKVILDDVTLAFYPGAKIGVVGPNGAGKSTVLRIMANLLRPDEIGPAEAAYKAAAAIVKLAPNA